MKRRLRAVAGLLALGGLTVPIGLAATPSPAGAAETSGSQVTKSGSGDRFEDLRVTVSQTKQLRNQVIKVSWSGFAQTTELTGTFSTNYLQILQCWEGEAEPTRESCQFGGLISDQRGGFAANKRQVSYTSTLVDPLETLKQPPGSFEPVRVPFKPVSGEPTTQEKHEYYDQYSTNEVPFARSSANGTGVEYFEVQTATEAPGLGCGQQTSSGPRSCWLVVVPRDDIEVNGLNAQATEERKLISSPLSASNWKNRISFKLEFEPLAVSCPIGAEERRLLGNEEIVEAVIRWQPKLCGETGSIFGYSQLSDGQARQQVLTDDPWMSIVHEPIDPEQNTDDRLLSYAPLGISGIGIGFNIDRQPRLDAPDAVVQKRGSRITQLKLNQRLVAKLLTQSYNLAALSRPAAIKDNPLSLTDDPEFVALNPEFADLQFMTIRQITNPLGLADANRELWAWVATSPEARSFIAGKPDKWGMRINPAYRGMSLDRADFPRADSGCRPGPAGAGELCPLDALAYAADFHDAGRGAARGDNLERSTWDPNPPASWKKNPPQLSGERQALALVDTATAARYQLPMASLANGAGAYVAPTRSAMSAAIDGFVETEVEGVLAGNPAYRSRAAYPLTSISYAVTAPRQLRSAAEAKAYAGFIRFATGKGQTEGVGPGQLPDGYVPLPAALRRQADRAADLIEKRGGPLPDGAETPASGGDAASGGTGADAPGAPIGPVAAGEIPVSQLPNGAPAPGTVNPVSSRTPSAPAGGARFLLVAALVLGVGVAVGKPAAPLVQHLLRKRGAGAP